MSKEKKPSSLEKMLDKNVNPIFILGFKQAFVANGKLKAKGRVYLKLVTVFISLIYFLGSMDMIVAGTFLALMTLLFPPIFNLTTKILVPKMNIEKNNLYDLLAGVGCYIVTMIAFVIIMVIGMNYVTNHYEAYFSSMKSIPGMLIIIAAILFAYDILKMKSEEKTRKGNMEAKEEL